MQEICLVQTSVERCLLILDLNPLRLKSKESIPEPGCARKQIVDIDILVTSRNGDRKIMQSVRIMSGPTSRIRKWNQFCHFR